MRINYIHGLLNECVNDNLPPINYFYPYHFNTLFDIIQSSDDKFVIFEGRNKKRSKGVSLLRSPHAIPEAAACLIVFILHKRKHNTRLSILSGTAAYIIILHIVDGAGI